MPFLFHDGIIFKLLDVLLYLLDDSLVIHQRCVIITKKSIFPRHLGIFTDFSQTHFLHTRIKFYVNFKSIHEFTTVSNTSPFSMNSWLVFILIKKLYHNYHYYWEDCSTIATWQCWSSLTKLFLLQILDDEDVKDASLRAFSWGLLTVCLHGGRKILQTGRS